MDKRIALEAAEWLVRIEEDRTPACQAQLVEWLESSPRHIDEFLLAAATSRVIRTIDPQRQIEISTFPTDNPNNVIAIPRLASPLTAAKEKPAADRPQAQSPRKPGLQHLWIAAALAAMAFAAWQWPDLNAFKSDTYATVTGEQRSFQLEDGSLLHLNTQSRVKVHYSKTAREMQLLEGEALFEVAHDSARPFRVTAGTAVILAIGTQFNVYRRETETTVAVVEGKVDVKSVEPSQAPSPQSASGENKEQFLRAGEEAQIKSNGHVVKATKPDVVTAVAWLQHRLVFRSERLDDIAAQFNRYNRVTLRIEGEATAEQRMSGTFNANEPDAFVQFLQQDPTISIERSGSSIVVRSR